MVALIANRYRIKEMIGQGGNGVVYTAYDLVDDVTVAIKQLRPEQIDTTPTVLERFRREGEALRELDHPNIVKILDMVEQDGNHYLIEEYFAGGDLQREIRSDLMAPERVIEIALGVADALTRAHSMNIIHRDLKPGNVLVGDDGAPHLTDFGVALIGHKKRMTEQGTPVGTIEYLSPEALTADVDNRSDIWAFGVMLFEMLTQERPFRGESLSVIVGQILTSPVPDLEILRPDAPLALVDLIYRMLEKDRNDRIASVRLIGAELEAIQQGTTLDVSTIPVASSMLIESRFAGELVPDVTRHNLPVTSQGFVGREYEVDEVLRLIDDPASRLITILGTGGVGKTRLALEVGFQCLRRFDNRVFFIDLAPLRDTSQIVTAIAEAMHFKFLQDDRSRLQQLAGYLEYKRALLILDNLEHLMEGVEIVTAILDACEDIAVLVTSRQRLNLSGEAVTLLGGMEFPGDSEFEQAIEYSAVKLFLQHARRIRPDFDLSQDDIVHVARVCELVEGLPLGIILAASWAGMLSIEEIASEIEENADFLATDMHDLPQRHRSMRAVFDYSWNLLSAAEQSIFAKMAVFRGGFSRDAAITVLGANLRMMMGLMNKSLLLRDVETGRYSIHDLLRAYAKEKLEASSLVEDVRDAHMAYYCELANYEAGELFGGAQLRAVETLDLEIDNIRAAWERAIIAKNSEHLSLMYPMWVYYDTLGLWDEAIVRAEASLQALAYSQTKTTGELYLMAGICAYRQGLYEKAKAYDQQAHQIFSELGIQEHLLMVRLNDLNIRLVIDHANETAVADYEDIITRARQMGLMWLESTAYLNLGYHYLAMGNLEGAESTTRRAIQNARTSNDLIMSGVATHNLGDIMYRKGASHAAKDLLTESFSIALMFNNVLLIYINLVFLSKVSVELDDPLAAYDYAMRAAGIAHESGVQLLFHEAMIAYSACLRDKFVEARPHLLQLVEAISEQHGLFVALPELLIALPFYLQQAGHEPLAQDWCATLLDAGIPEAPLQAQLSRFQRETGQGRIISDLVTAFSSLRGLLS